MNAAHLSIVKARDACYPQFSLILSVKHRWRRGIAVQNLSQSTCGRAFLKRDNRRCGMGRKGQRIVDLQCWQIAIGQTAAKGDIIDLAITAIDMGDAITAPRNTHLIKRICDHRRVSFIMIKRLTLVQNAIQNHGQVIIAPRGTGQIDSLNL